MFELLSQLCAIDCTGGHEQALRDYISEKVCDKAERIETDVRGNLKVYVKGEKRPEKGAVVVAAPMDEVGFVLTEWGSCGCVKLTRMDNMDVKSVIGRRFRITGKPETKGVISLVSQHLTGRSGTDSYPELRDVQLDFGCINDEQIKAAVALGDQAVYDYPLATFGEGCVRGKALECRAGCAVLIRTILETVPKYDTCYLFTASKYIDHRGSVTAARDIDPNIVLSVDYAAAGDVPMCEEFMSSVKLHGGAALGIKEVGSIYSRPLREQIKAMAEKHSISWQYRSGMYGQSDAGNLHTYGRGAAVAGISVPVRYALSAMPVAAMEDFEAAVRLTECFVTEVDENAL